MTHSGTFYIICIQIKLIFARTQYDAFNRPIKRAKKNWLDAFQRMERRKNRLKHTEGFDLNHVMQIAAI